jgi:hypothetical protein
MAKLVRTQIYLTETEVTALDRIEEETGVSRSELVRRALDRSYLGPEALSREERVAIARRTAGAWKGRTETGAEYVERLRSGRLARLHGLKK